MNEECGLFKNNKGGALVVVIVCIAFVSILGSLVLSLTVTNHKIKVINKKSKANFYATEIAFDEIKKGLEEVVADSIEYAYNEMMKVYINDGIKVGEGDDEILISKEEVFKNAYFDKTKEKLYESDSEIGKYNIGTIQSFIEYPGIILDIAAGSNELVIDGSSITLKNIKVNYTDVNNYKTTLSSDIVINEAYFKFNQGLNKTIDFAGYSLIADKQIKLHTAIDVEVNGDVYAGDGGINLDNRSSLLINNAKYIITRDKISLKDRSSLEVTRDGGSNVWAKDIVTLSGVRTEESTDINLNANVYLANDLMLNANKTIAKIKGNFYGYGHDLSRDPDNSSAIIINGESTNLDLSELEELVVAGRAFVNPKSNNNQSGSTQGIVQTGESLAIKGNQHAYLVPKELMWCGMNPVPSTTYATRPANEVDFSKVITEDKMVKNITDYANGFSNLFYQSAGEHQGYVYYYLKFKTNEDINKYMQKYNSLNYVDSGDTSNRIKNYADAIVFDGTSNHVLSVGNMFSYDKNLNKSALWGNKINPNLADSDSMKWLNEKSSEYTGKYRNLQRRLSESPGEVNDNDSLFNSILFKDKIINDSSGSDFNDGVKVVEVDEYAVYIINKDVTRGPFKVPRDAKPGIIVSVADVELDSGMEYTGLILSGTDIILKGGAKAMASREIVMSILNAKNSSINKYFRDYSGFVGGGEDGSSGGVSVPDLVEYDNWAKNED